MKLFPTPEGSPVLDGSIFVLAPEGTGDPGASSTGWRAHLSAVRRAVARTISGACEEPAGRA